MSWTHSSIIPSRHPSPSPSPKSTLTLTQPTPTLPLTTSGELDALKQSISQLQGQEMMLDDYILLMQVRTAPLTHTRAGNAAAPRRCAFWGKKTFSGQMLRR